MQPLVSVIIATYNGKEKRFKQTLESILNQSYNNIELIIVNDCSTNNIGKFIQGYCKKYKNIIYLKNETNCERSYSRNKGIFESKGKYIAFCDDDDIWKDKDKIKKQVKLLEDNKKCMMCGTSIIEVDEDNNETNKVTVRHGNNNLKNSLLQSNQFALSSVMIRKEVLCYSGLFNVKYNKAEDYDLWLRIGRFGELDNIKDSFIWYRTWQGNTSTTANIGIKKNAFKFMRNNKKHYPYFLRALILRIGDFLLPNFWCIKILSFIKNKK